MDRKYDAKNTQPNITTKDLIMFMNTMGELTNTAVINMCEWADMQPPTTATTTAAANNKNREGRYMGVKKKAVCFCAEGRLELREVKNICFYWDTLRVYIR